MFHPMSREVERLKEGIRKTFTQHVLYEFTGNKELWKEIEKHYEVKEELNESKRSAFYNLQQKLYKMMNETFETEEYFMKGRIDFWYLVSEKEERALWTRFKKWFNSDIWYPYRVVMGYITGILWNIWDKTHVSWDIKKDRRKYKERVEKLEHEVMLLKKNKVVK